MNSIPQRQLFVIVTVLAGVSSLALCVCAQTADIPKNEHTKNEAEFTPSKKNAVDIARKFVGLPNGVAATSAERSIAIGNEWHFASAVSADSPAWIVTFTDIIFDVANSTARQQDVNTNHERAEGETQPLTMTVAVMESNGLVLGARSSWITRSADDFTVLDLQREAMDRGLRAEGEAWDMPTAMTSKSVAGAMGNICQHLGCRVVAAEQVVVQRVGLRKEVDLRDGLGEPPKVRRESTVQALSVELRCHSDRAHLGGAVEAKPPSLRGTPANDPKLAWYHTPDRVRARKVSVMRFMLSDDSLTVLSIRNTPFPEVIERTPDLQKIEPKTAEPETSGGGK